MQNLKMSIGGSTFEWSGDEAVLDADLIEVARGWFDSLPSLDGGNTASVLAEIQHLKEADVTQKADVAALATRLDTATNEIASDLKDLRQKVEDGTITTADLAPLDATIARLETLGKDPENPIPGSPDPEQPVGG